jgi:hypothetical protein
MRPTDRVDFTMPLSGPSQSSSGSSVAAAGSLPWNGIAGGPSALASIIDSITRTSAMPSA